MESMPFEWMAHRVKAIHPQALPSDVFGLSRVSLLLLFVATDSCQRLCVLAFSSLQQKLRSWATGSPAVVHSSHVQIVRPSFGITSTFKSSQFTSQMQPGSHHIHTGVLVHFVTGDGVIYLRVVVGRDAR